jgi:transcriptional regulator with XRE-family HTH domain
MTIIEKLVKQRKQLGLTQTALAERMNVTQVTVSEFEKSASPTLKTLERYAKAVGMRVTAVREDEVCTGED